MLVKGSTQHFDVTQQTRRGSQSSRVYHDVVFYEQFIIAKVDMEGKGEHCYQKDEQKQPLQLVGVNLGHTHPG